MSLGRIRAESPFSAPIGHLLSPFISDYRTAKRNLRDVSFFCGNYCEIDPRADEREDRSAEMAIANANWPGNPMGQGQTHREPS
jgi:hypothetical protein